MIPELLDCHTQFRGPPRSRSWIRSGFPVCTDTEALAAEMKTAASQATALVVAGEPDTGKSALALRTALRLRADDAAVKVLNLREMPAALVEFEALLGARIAAVLGASAVGTGRLLLVDGAESVLEGRAPVRYASRCLFRDLRWVRFAGRGGAGCPTAGSGRTTRVRARCGCRGRRGA
ncbi:sigma 54-interacting transcriptional regulator [Streptomyces sp. NPDC048479]|uniref:sigma 54-interacting transcriptional regulator n=1 Tax=Streptomyces sp. NPDC048479 TaxID=3154725 RepID=UPI0034237B45